VHFTGFHKQAVHAVLYQLRNTPEPGSNHRKSSGKSLQYHQWPGLKPLRRDRKHIVALKERHNLITRYWRKEHDPPIAPRESF
jgi:hypothetical protein